jgi:hypothetical protein
LSEELVGQRLDDLGPGASHVRSHVERALRGERFVVDIELADRVFTTVVEPLREDDGAISGAMGISTDVTARRRLEEQVAQEQRDRAAVELAIERLHPGLSLDALASATVTELVRLADVDRANVLGFGPRGLVVVLASEGVPVPGLGAGQRLPSGRARYMRVRARQGAWVEAWEPREFDGSCTLLAYEPMHVYMGTGLMQGTRQRAQRSERDGSGELREDHQTAASG